VENNRARLCLALGSRVSSYTSQGLSEVSSRSTVRTVSCKFWLRSCAGGSTRALLPTPDPLVRETTRSLCLDSTPVCCPSTLVAVRIDSKRPISTGTF
jgi:hypothetical protein